MLLLYPDNLGSLDFWPARPRRSPSPRIEARGFDETILKYAYPR